MFISSVGLDGSLQYTHIRILIIVVLGRIILTFLAVLEVDFHIQQSY